jgi:predicted oxidoreductase
VAPWGQRSDAVAQGGCSSIGGFFGQDSPESRCSVLGMEHEKDLAPSPWTASSQLQPEI